MPQQQYQQSVSLAGPGMMFFSAAIFGYFGFFYATWSYYSIINGQFLLFVALLDWTLKVSAIANLVSGLITFANAKAGNLLYGIVGLLGALMFLVIAAMDILDKQHTAISPFLLLIFAAWNGYASFSGLKELLIAHKNKDISANEFE